MPINTKKVSAFRADPPALMDHYFPSHYRFTFAASVKGPIQSAFPNAPGALTQSKKPLHAVIVSDTDMLYDSFWSQTKELDGQRIASPFSNNAHFVLNALDWLSGNDALISIRNHTSFSHPFTRIQALEANSTSELQEKRQQLLMQLATTQEKLKLLGNTDGAIALSVIEKEKLNRFRQDMLSTREQLRQVQHTLQRDLDALQNRLIMVNMVFVPMIIAILTLMVSLIKSANRRQRAQIAQENAAT